jgi:F-type H+-transporting ATPase subunit delta
MSAIANRYAKALADVVSQDGSITQAREALNGFNQLLANHKELDQVFSNPTIPIQQKRGVMDALIERMQPPKTITNFLRLLLDNYRLHQLGNIVAAFDLEMDRRIGTVSAQVTTAGPITEAERQSLTDKLNRMTGKQVRLEFNSDPEIVGGVVTRIGSVIYDGSIRSQLQQIEAKLRSE